MFRATETSAALSMSGGKIQRSIEQAAEVEALDAAHRAANQFPPVEVRVRSLSERVAELEQRVQRLETPE